MYTMYISHYDFTDSGFKLKKNYTNDNLLTTDF